MTEPLRVLVYPHAMDVGGSQINAIELAGAVRDLGHDVTVIGDDGPLVDMVHGLGLPHVPIPFRRRRPSPPLGIRLRRMVRQRSIDIVHGFEWPPGLEAAFSVYGRPNSAAVCTVMSSGVAPFVPRGMPLIVGTRILQHRMSEARPGPVYLIEPPVDTVQNAPGHPSDEFRARHGLDRPIDGRDPVTIAIVCRLVPELKLEGILAAVDAMGTLAAEHPVRLVIVGDGVARDQVAARAAKANAQAGREAVILTGEILDPRPAYAAADIMLGMGGSALRALAFGRPLVVQGERAFWDLLTPDTAERFLHQGWYGIGPGTDGAERLTAILRTLLADRARRADLGAFGRDLVLSRFSLQAAARAQEDIYRQSLRWTAREGAFRADTADGFRSSAGLFRYKVRARYQRIRGTIPRDDFNTADLAAAAVRHPPTP